MTNDGLGITNLKLSGSHSEPAFAGRLVSEPHR